MPTPSWDDLDDFLDPDDFAVQVVVTLQAGGQRRFQGIFDAPYFDADLGEYVADSDHPRVACKASDVQGVTRGDTALINGTTYDILTNPQTDGTGMAKLEMATQGL